MSTQKTSDASIDEMDLTDIFSLFKRGFYWFLALCFRAVDFMLKFWWVLLILIALGVAAGKFLKGETKYRSTLIVQTNFESQPYVYNAVEQFVNNLSEKDTIFINEIGFDIESPEIGGAEINPIIDVTGLLEELKGNDSRSLSTVIKELSVEDDTEVFASDRFYSNYKYHKLEVYLRMADSKQPIERLLKYINDQPQISEIKESAVKNLEERIAQNEKTLNQIDALIDNYTNNIGTAVEAAKDLSFYNNQNNLNINGVLALKNTLVEETEKLKNEFVTYSDAVVVISDIQTSKDEGLRDKKHIMYPIILVFLFLFLAAIRYTYKTLRTQLVEENLLD